MAEAVFGEKVNDTKWDKKFNAKTQRCEDAKMYVLAHENPNLMLESFLQKGLVTRMRD
jgi:hypothetical protein